MLTVRVVKYWNRAQRGWGSLIPGGAERRAARGPEQPHGCWPLQQRAGPGEHWGCVVSLRGSVLREILAAFLTSAV